MNDWTWLVIQGCWATWLVIWVAMAFATKRTVERGGVVGYRLVAGALILGVLAIGRSSHLSSHSQLWSTPLVLGIATDVMVVAGFAFCVWARIVLGRNWSGEVTFKEGHELIESGPYAFARHPIYTGLIVMALGTALNFGRASASSSWRRCAAGSGGRRGMRSAS
jgi:protein-S-isoprenylcysteine O-methyltransferase Ste14